MCKNSLCMHANETTFSYDTLDQTEHLETEHLRENDRHLAGSTTTQNRLQYISCTFYRSASPHIIPLCVDHTRATLKRMNV